MEFSRFDDGLGFLRVVLICLIGFFYCFVWYKIDTSAWFDGLFVTAVLVGFRDGSRY